MSSFSRIAVCSPISATGKRITITKPLTASATDDTVYLSEALNIDTTQLNKCDYVAIALPNSNNTGEEVIICTKANYDSSAKTMSSCTRGLIGYGIGLTSDATQIGEHYAGTQITVPVLVQNMVQIQDAIEGDIATGANAFRTGDETDSDIYYYFQNADANKPGLRYNATQNRIEFSDDGSSWTALNQSGNHGTTANLKDHTDVAAAVSDSDAQGDILIRDGTSWNRLAAGTAGQVLKTGGAGANPEWDDADDVVGAELQEAITFFGATDFSSDDANAAGAFISDYTAKEDIAVREVVAYVPASSSATIVDQESETGTSRSIGGASPIVGAAIRVTLPDLINRITSIKLMLSKSTATVGTIIVKGFPTTTDMNNSTNEMFSETIDVADIASSPTYELETITFGTPLEVTLKKIFYIRIEGSGTDGFVLLSATNSGSGVYFDNDITTRNYSSTSQTPAYSVQGYLDTAGIVKGDASDATRARVIGLAVAAITSGNTGAVQTQGLMSGFSLADSFVGNEIYLSDTEGAIVTTPGTVERKIGNAISTSKIIINT